jgi:hypothetical protein
MQVSKTAWYRNVFKTVLDRGVLQIHINFSVLNFFRDTRIV